MNLLDSTPGLSEANLAERFEEIACYQCGGRGQREFVIAEDDLTGKPGRFRFVTCTGCGLVYQNPRLRLEQIKPYYGDDYIAHRPAKAWGPFAPLFRYAMEGVERRKERLVACSIQLTDTSRVLDVGCGAGGFLHLIRRRYGAQTTGVDFKDLSDHPALAGSRFLRGLFYEQDFGEERFHLITMWHYLEHDYDPVRSLATARSLLSGEGCLVVEVPRLDSFSQRLFRERWPGLQAPQHTVLFSRRSLVEMVESVGLKVVAHLPYGAFPAYFYLFTGAAFKLLRGRGLNLRKAVLPYFAGQVLFLPVLVFERRLNLAMQTVICRKPS